MKDGLKRYRDFGGKRAIVATVGVNLDESMPLEPLTDETRFTLRCNPANALERVQAAEALGYDDVLLRKDDLTIADVVQLADLLQLSKRKVTPSDAARSCRMFSSRLRPIPAKPWPPERIVWPWIWTSMSSQWTKRSVIAW